MGGSSVLDLVCLFLLVLEEHQKENRNVLGRPLKQDARMFLLCGDSSESSLFGLERMVQGETK